MVQEVKRSYFFYDENTLNKGYSKDSNYKHNYYNHPSSIESIKNQHKLVLNATQNIIISSFKKMNLIFLFVSLTIIVVTSLYLVSSQLFNELYIFILSSLTIMLIGYLINIYKIQKLTRIELMYDQLYNSSNSCHLHNNLKL
ncbi:hypothetical protein OCHUTO_0077 [Orientia chuto str. Dubai]|uniref:Uncharacterized protein n=1 Tax=Orientia chuto str. Dubai TaxID=1359168 RepID=A0A0F3MP34_9RICK|nr:hypothetical protein [Candidatus Orientia mediorientalis]KJV57538.1 hypothetical protein OCHUTO_0077 [Orientia chuto str. Dubai]